MLIKVSRKWSEVEATEHQYFPVTHRSQEIDSFSLMTFRKNQHYQQLDLNTQTSELWDNKLTLLSNLIGGTFLWYSKEWI